MQDLSNRALCIGVLGLSSYLIHLKTAKQGLQLGVFVRYGMMVIQNVSPIEEQTISS